MASIEIANVRKDFGAVPVLKGVDLSIASGEFAVLVGPSGCGKSTLLRLIAGLEDASSGDVHIDGRRVNDLPPRDRDIAMVFQSYALYPHMNVRDNMAYSLKLKRTPAARIAEAVGGAAAKLGLEALAGRKPRELSGGQRQRVAMGRAIVRNPKAFLFDEPLSNLDARMREQMRFEIRKLHRDLGATSVYVTHDQIEAMTMADRIVAMNAGIIQQVGTPLELYDDPANMFVAGFIGSPAMNFLDARARRGEHGIAITVGGTAFCTLPQSLSLPEDGHVKIGIRPERIRIGASGGEGVDAAVDMVETTGAASVAHLDLAGQPLKVFTTERLQFAQGQRVPLAFDTGHVCLFDGASGDRLR
ncbi:MULTISPECIES: sn-glycerol-3-phosphate ABC transporter ATP-binding protein UgpC [unclassified Mesorhizobium]|uniref:ABC transporter ATP-binding protein n=1 Tax=unclassified Mesorhizobium TaxID=325217 RepID=UPI00095E6275|nr:MULTISPECIES: sn-glycerol-3-phosphate ABC transporter ATP-binding protein UgpC [unclassified Mesorhizobium]MBN9255035.1 sn-glycerol-3-phosphate ABC transporter ATP-binding protein UgpC [Mesorhizobium sp.]OJX76061.1 MAG: glycerol-3-phosphate ABC transporter ATP-binding protein [Mesorhizobium sp. 65-26]